MKKVIKILKKILLLYILMCISSTAIVNAQNNCIKTKIHPKSKHEKLVNTLEKKGMARGDIQNLTDNQIEEFVSNNTTISTKYYRVNDTKGVITEIKEKEIDELLEMYEPESLKSNDDFQLSLNPLDCIGTQVAKANDSDLRNSSDGYMRQTLVTSDIGKKVGGKKVYKIYYVAKWLKMPINRRIDVLGVSNDDTMSVISNNSTYPITAKEYHTYAHYRNENFNSAYKISNASSSLTGDLKIGYGIAVPWNLPDDSRVKGNEKLVTSMYACLTYYVKAKSSVKSFDVFSCYKHQEKSYSITPSISVGAPISGGAGISISGESHFVEERPNCHCNQNT